MTPILHSLLETDLYKFTMWQTMLHRHPQAQAEYRFVCRNAPAFPLAELDRFDRVLIAGEAGSHCVRATVEHLAAHLPSARMNKLVLLTDCISPVAGFEAQQAEFLAAMQARGLQLALSTEI